MLRLGSGREIFRADLQRRLFLAGAHATRPRHSRRLRPAQERDREAHRARAHGAARHGDDGLTPHVPEKWSPVSRLREARGNACHMARCFGGRRQVRNGHADMKKPMAFARRLAVVAAAYLVAAAGATAAMIAASWLRSGIPGSGAAVVADSLVWLTFLAGTYITAAAAPPSLVAIALAELNSWRLLRIYVVVGIAIALLTYNAGIGDWMFGPSEYGFPHDMQDIIIAGGLVGGVIYWATAGRRAGRAKGPSSEATVRPAPERPAAGAASKTDEAA